jgi:hypothetical protein
MSANFLDKSGWMVGADPHVYFTPGPAGVPLPGISIYVVACLHAWPSRDWRIAHSVTTDNWSTLQSNWSMLLVVHVPIYNLPPHPGAEPPYIVAVIGASSSAPTMSAHSVTGEGQALLTALVGFFGFNLNCGLPSLPSGLDFNPNSVKTTPTLGDYVSSFFGMVYNSMYANVVGVVGWKWNWTQALDFAILQNLLDFFDAKNISIICDPIVWMISKITGKIQSLVDDATSAPSTSPALGQ